MFTAIMLLCSLSSCTSNFEKTDSSNVGENSNIYISEDEVFSIKTPHFCYFFLSTCSSCEAVKSKIELYANEHSDFYMLEAPSVYQKGITKEDSVGVECVDEIKFLGFPTLIFVENGSLKKMYVGINEITNFLF